MSTARVPGIKDYYTQKYFRNSQNRPSLELLQSSSKLTNPAVRDLGWSRRFFTPQSNERELVKRLVRLWIHSIVRDSRTGEQPQES